MALETAYKMPNDYPAAQEIRYGGLSGSRPQRLDSGARMRRREKIELRVSTEEKAALVRRAKAQGMGVSEFLRVLGEDGGATPKDYGQERAQDGPVSSVTFQAPAHFHARIKQAAVINDMSVSAYIRTAMWLAVATKPPVEQEVDEVVEADVVGGPMDPPDPRVLKACPRCGPPQETHCKRCGLKLRPGGV